MGGERRIRGGQSSRTKFICEFNEFFNRRNVQATVARLGRLVNTGDALDICERLGLFAEMHDGDFSRYREELLIPDLNLGVVTAALRQALTAKPSPVPFQLLVVSGTHEVVTVTCTESAIACVLARNDRRRSPRKRAAGTA